MDKTININLGGTLFQIDEDAYRILRDYLNNISSRFRNVQGGNETMEDIESRIAEIFLSQKGMAGVIMTDNVEAMIKILGRPEEFGQPEGYSSAFSGGSSTSSKKMYRNPHDTIIGGVCGGIGTYLNTDPVWIRLLFVVFTFFFGIGLFVYLALWLALPSADNDTKLKEMYGTSYHPSGPDDNINQPAYRTSSKVGHAFNEGFRAIGKVIFIFFRIILIVTGTCIIAACFLALLSFIMVFVFKYPGSFSTDAVGFNIAYVPDFINYIVSPASAPWIKVLISAVIILPLLALIYGGIRLIFWFRVRDGFVWLAGFLLWVMCAAALSIILFNEGIGYAETQSVRSEEYFNTKPDTLFIVGGKKMQGLNTDKEITIPDEKYDILISEENKELYIRSHLNIEYNEGNSPSVEILKHSAGRSRLDAIKHAEELNYDYRISGDTLRLDEYFTIPKGRKWSFDYVKATVKVPGNTVIHMDNVAGKLYHPYRSEDFMGDPKKSYWRMTEDGLEYLSH